MAESVSEDVVSFYKKALVPAGHISEEDPYQNLFYYLQGLACPWDGYNDFQLRKLNGEGISQKARYILLYTATKLSKTGQGGIILDQHTGQASMQTDLFSIEPTSMIWQPLLTILTTYLDLIVLGKVTAANFKSVSAIVRPGEAEPQHPWVYHSYSPEILARSLAAYHSLISAIEAARKGPAEKPDHELTVYLSTHYNLDAASFPKDSFVRSFLTAARRPRGPKRIRFIAPGIELPSTISIRNQPFRAVAKKYRFASGVPGMPSVSDEEGNDPLYPPFLLFPGQGAKPNKKEASDQTVFAAPFHDLDECPAGLWVDRAEPWSGRGGEDEAVVVMPLETTRMICTPFEAGSRMPLFAVLEMWTQMVENGKWEVDERGVVGEIECLRQQRNDKSEVRGRSRLRSR